MTRCKLGDRAIIVKSIFGNEGRIVIVVDDLGSPSQNFVYAGKPWRTTDGMKVWGIKTEGSKLNSEWGPIDNLAALDAALKPFPKLTEPSLELETTE
jgi:hypothetical protein